MERKFLDQVISADKESASIREALTRGVATDESGRSMILPDRDSLEVEMKSRRLKLYLGIDPTSPELHIGHTVPLRKLRQFQDLGHEVVLLFGTFTGMIGDPSDKGAARVRLTRDQINQNILAYAEQAGKILDLSEGAKNPISIVHNDEWLSPINFEGVVDLAANITVQRLMERKMFAERLQAEKPIYVHEFLYPLMQGYDSVAMGVDIEVGGKDQVFNMLVGRDLVKKYLAKEKWVLPTRLIEDPSGKKMGKSEGNIVGIRDLPEAKYEGVMTWPDSAIGMGFELITSVPMEQVYIVNEMLQSGELGPLETKEALAFRVVAELNGIDEARFAMEEFDRVKRKGQLPSRMKSVSTPSGEKLSLILVASGLVKTAAEAAAKIAQGATCLDGKSVNKDIVITSDTVLQLGKKSIGAARKIVIDR